MSEDSFFDDVLDVVGTVAPGLAAALVAPGWAVMGVRAIGKALLGDEKASEEQVRDAIRAASPEDLIKLREEDNRFQEAMANLNVDIFALQVQQENNYLQDVQNARGIHGDDPKIFWLGVLILMTFANVMAFSMYGCYVILSGGITIKDPGVIAAVFGFLGTVVGYVAANAQQVVGFFFGSSSGSSKKSDAIADAISNFSKIQKK